jgi:hypothetical protein
MAASVFSVAFFFRFLSATVVSRALRWQERLCWLLKGLVYAVGLYVKGLGYAKFRQRVPVAFFFLPFSFF